MKSLVLKTMLFVLLGLILLSPFVINDRWNLIEKKGVLKYGTRTSLLSYFDVGDEIVGYEYNLLKDFADSHGLILETEVYSNNGNMLDDLEQGKIDIAGGHLSATKQRGKRFSFSSRISQTAIDLVTHFEYRNLQYAADFEELRGQLISNSSYEELLDDLPHFQPQNLEQSQKETLFELFSKVNKQEIDYTFADSEITHIYRYFIPGIYQAVQLSPKEDIVFLAPKRRSQTFLNKLNVFIQEAHESKMIEQYKSAILDHLPQIDIADTVTFFDKLQTQWPQVKQDIIEVATRLNFDPAMLAAISYQESHWNPEAVSISGVKGLMMLTESTAEEMNVSNRTDSVESLTGGIKYFRKMKNKIPRRIAEPDRTLFALAAYNVGFGHLEDARILTQRAGKNPDIWLEVEPYLEQLNNPAISHELKYGIADGKTAVIYVNNIMTYKQLMTWKLQKESLIDLDQTYL